MASVRTRVLTGFDDSFCDPERWEQVARRGATDVLFLTWHWLRAWWETVGEGDLLLVAAEKGGQIVAVAPFYASEGMVFFLGAGESDYIDFVGQTADPDVMAALLATAREQAPNFLGFKLHEIPDRSPTGRSLQTAAGRIGLICMEEGELPTVEIDMAGRKDEVLGAVSRSMLKREEYCRRHGVFEVRHLDDVDAIRPHLAEYYAQHIARWQAKGLSGPFSDPRQRAFLERFLELAARTGWIRFLRIDWKGRPLAFEFAWYYQGAHYSARWCFALEYANQSPGQILLRQSVLAALAAGLHTYDLGSGDQDYKLRLPVRVHMCRTWGLYPT